MNYILWSDLVANTSPSEDKTTLETFPEIHRDTLPLAFERFQVIINTLNKLSEMLVKLKNLSPGELKLMNSILWSDLVAQTISSEDKTALWASSESL